MFDLFNRKKVATLTARVEDLLRINNTLGKQVTSLSMSVNERNEEVARLRAEVMRLDKQFKPMSHVLSELDKSQVAHLRDLSTRLQLQVGELKHQLQVRDSELKYVRGLLNTRPAAADTPMVYSPPTPQVDVLSNTVHRMSTSDGYPIAAFESAPPPAPAPTCEASSGSSSTSCSE